MTNANVAYVVRLKIIVDIERGRTKENDTYLKACLGDALLDVKSTVECMVLDDGNGARCNRGRRSGRIEEQVLLLGLTNVIFVFDRLRRQSEVRHCVL